MSRKQALTIAAALPLLVACLALSAEAISFDLAADWSDTANPTGPWSYNDGAAGLANHVADWLPGHFGGPQPAWAVSASGVPGWAKSMWPTGPASLDFPVGRVGAHGSESGPVSVTWTSPFSGMADIDGGAWMMRDIGRSMSWKLYLNSTLLDSGTVSSGDAFHSGNPDSFDLSVLLAAFDVVKLELVKTDSSCCADFVGVDLTIAAVPEPSSLVFWASSLAALAGIRWRTRRP